jgi:SulP family sulfate permease
MLQWGRAYDRSTFIDDGVAALIVTLMLIPQSLAYAMLAGLPAQAGLYASIAPLLAYAVFGSSRVLAVGPVAVISLMTATAVGTVAVPGTAEHAAAALTLAALSGAVLLLMGALRLGFVAHFLSHPVISGFITASAILIAAGQLKTLLGVKAEGHTLPQILASVGGQWSSVHGLRRLSFCSGHVQVCVLRSHVVVSARAPQIWWPRLRQSVRSCSAPACPGGWTGRLPG